MATDRAQRFTSRSEAERARPRLSPDNSVPLEQFADLVGDYKFPNKREWVRCQLVDDKGECKQLHGWGWIAQLESGAEGYIGHECAEDHFEADPRFAGRFAASRARVTREITTDLLVARLRKLLDDPTIGQALNTAIRRRGRLHDRVMDVRNALPPQLLRKLTERAKRDNTAVMVRIVYVEIEVDEKTAKRREIHKPQALPWGNLAGLGGLDHRPLSRIGGKLADADAALMKAVASTDQPVRTMQKWATSLEYVDRADAELDQRHVLIDNFCRPENLKLLWLLLDKRFEQLAAIRSVLGIMSRKHITDDEAASMRAAWSEEIRAAHGGREFQVVG